MKQMRKELGKYLLDVSKLIFGGMVLTAVLDVSENDVLIISVGFMASILFAISGFMFLNNKRKRRKKK